MQGSCTLPCWRCLLQGAVGVLAFVMPKAIANSLAASRNLQLCSLPSTHNLVLFTGGAVAVFSRLSAGVFCLCCFAAVLMVLHLWLYQCCCDGLPWEATATYMRTLLAFPPFPCLWLLWFIFGSLLHICTKLNNQSVCSTYSWTKGALVCTESHKQGGKGRSLCA